MRSIITISLLSLLIFVSVAFADDPTMMWGQDWNYCPYCGQYLGPRGGYGMGPGMMGRGYGMGRGMMGPGMMGPGYWQSEECQKFFNENAALRRELHNKRFDYSEAMRNPKVTPESLGKLEKEIRELQEKIYSKSPQGCWWQN